VNLRSTVDELIASGECCRAHLAAVNPETGQYRVILRERRPPAPAGSAHATAPAGDRPGFTIRDLPTVGWMDTPKDTLRARIAAMLEVSRAVSARIDRDGPGSGEVRIVLEGTLGSPEGAPPDDSERQEDATRKLKSSISAPTLRS
jgi:hypothetical protein